MKKETYKILLENPCGENWNQMPNTKEGKFCNACSRNLVDFTIMSDNEILAYLAKNSQTVCGRFSETQLNRPLQQSVIKRTYGYVYKLLASFLFFGISHESKSKDTVDVNQHFIANHVHDSDTIVQSKSNLSEIKGIVIDKLTGTPLDYVIIKLTRDSVFYDGTYSNLDGEFRLLIETNDSSIFELTITHFDYDTLKIVVTPQMFMKELKLELVRNKNYKENVCLILGMPSINRIEKKPWWKRMWKRKSKRK